MRLTGINRRFIALTGVLLALLSPACMVFEQQTLTYRYDAAADELRIFQVYEGIYSTGKSFTNVGTQPADTAKQFELDRQQLTSVVDGERTFFFTNWIWEYDRAWIAELLAEPGHLPFDPESGREFQTALKLLFDNLRVQNGRFYFNELDRLSGYQMVTFTNVSGTIDAFRNAVNHLFIISEGGQRTKLKNSLRIEDMQLIMEAATAGHEWLTITPDVIRLRIPVTRAALALYSASEMTFDPATGNGTLDKAPPSIRQALTIRHADNMLTIELRSGPKGINTITGPFKSGYEPTIVDYAINTWGVIDRPDIDAVRRGFLE